MSSSAGLLSNKHSDRQYREETRDVYAVKDPHNKQGFCQVRWTQESKYVHVLSSAYVPWGSSTRVTIEAADGKIKELSFGFLKSKEEVKLGDVVETDRFSHMYWADMRDGAILNSGVVKRIQFSYFVPVCDQRMDSRALSK